MNWLEFNVFANIICHIYAISVDGRTLVPFHATWFGRACRGLFKAASWNDMFVAKSSLEAVHIRKIVSAQMQIYRKNINGYICNAGVVVFWPILTVHGWRVFCFFKKIL